MFQLCGQDLIEAAMTVYVEVVRSPQQMHRKDQSHHTQVVVTVKVRDEQMADAVKVRLKTHELHLRAFAAIDEKIPVFDFHQLRGRISAMGRQRAA